MQNEDKEKEKSIETAIYFHNKGYLPGHGHCSCRGNHFKIYKEPNYKLNCCSFSSNKKCRKKFPITIKSFY